jgi:hypothetical protein
MFKTIKELWKQAQAISEAIELIDRIEKSLAASKKMELKIREQEGQQRFRRGNF